MQLAQNLWRLTGSFRAPEGEAKETENGFFYDGGGYLLKTTRETDQNGVCLQRTTLTNTSDKPLHVGSLLSRFALEDGEYEVYTQTTEQLAESMGLWQPLHSGVCVRSPYIRSSYGATPMIALWNMHLSRGIVLHLLAEGAWEITAERIPSPAKKQIAVCDLGLDPRQTDLTLAPGQTLSFPDILYYTFFSRRDLDCHKLHAWLNRNLPRKALPVVYNSWLYCFGDLTFEGMLAQIPRAKALGCDYFVLDASWYGHKGNWKAGRGDWQEYPDGTLGGRMVEISEAVRNAGMGFGFWIEAETASPGVQILKDHPDYYFSSGGNYFLDFANPKAVSDSTEITCALVERYHASFIKFDFNQDLDCDPRGTAFTAYHAGHRRYIEAIRSRFPEIYLECCASGGMRMALSELRMFDSFWLSDNQSPYHGLRIVKDTLLRMPPQPIERWIVAASATDFPDNHQGRLDRIFAVNSSSWIQVRSVKPSFYRAFANGGVLGFSCDLRALSDEDFSFFQSLSAAWKQDRAFWQNAVGRILCDLPTLLILQYSDEALTEVRVQLTTLQIRQPSAVAIPVLDAQAHYRLFAPGHPQDGAVQTGAQWMLSGVNAEAAKPFESRFYTLKTVPSEIFV